MADFQQLFTGPFLSVPTRSSRVTKTAFLIAILRPTAHSNATPPCSLLDKLVNTLL
jgi:hypothetical protein